MNPVVGGTSTHNMIVSTVLAIRAKNVTLTQIIRVHLDVRSLVAFRLIQPTATNLFKHLFTKNKTHNS
jgi:hypothetical protein